MQLHANAALSLNQRRRMVRRVVEEGWSLRKAAEAAEVSDRTCAKWVARYRADGEAGLLDRSSAPRHIPHRTSAERVEVIAIAPLRRLRMTGAEIAECLGMALSTVSAVLGRIGLGKLSRLEPFEPANRYARRAAGELLHIDVKKLGRLSCRTAQSRARGQPHRKSIRDVPGFRGERRTNGLDPKYARSRCLDWISSASSRPSAYPSPPACSRRSARSTSSSPARPPIAPAAYAAASTSFSSHGRFVAGGDAQFVEHLVEVVFGRARADEQTGLDLGDRRGRRRRAARSGPPGQ